MIQLHGGITIYYAYNFPQGHINIVFEFLNMVNIQHINAHEQPPESLRSLFQEYRRLKIQDVDSHPRIVDLARLDEKGYPDGLYHESTISLDSIVPTFSRFLLHGSELFSSTTSSNLKHLPVYAHKAIPGQ